MKPFSALTHLDQPLVANCPALTKLGDSQGESEGAVVDGGSEGNEGGSERGSDRPNEMPDERPNERPSEKEMQREALPNPRNLLISPVKSLKSRENKSRLQRQPSIRIANAQQKKENPDPRPDEEGYTVQFRVYPYPPTQKPLSFPLVMGSPAKTITKRTSSPARRFAAQTAKTVAQQPARKQLLRRWQTDHDMQQELEQEQAPALVAQPAPKNVLSASASNNKPSAKRTRSPPPLPQRRHSHFDLDEGDPVLPDIAAKPSDGAKRVSMKRRRHATTSERGLKHVRVSYNNDKNKRLHRQSTNLSSNRLPTLSLSHQPGPNQGVLQALKSKIDGLKDRRKWLEQQVLDEIARAASDDASLTVSKDDRLALKRDIERLPSHAIRDLLRLISRRMRGLEVAPQVEVQLQLDILPADLTRELKLLVMTEKGEASIKARGELKRVRKELRDVQREYETQKKLVTDGSL